MSEPPLFTILLPVVRPPDYLPFAIRSIQAQVEKRFELMVVCDGAPQATVEAARAMAVEDSRIQVLPFPKGPRHGEAYRHTALQSARGKMVCQISDDDLWMPNHLVEIAALLETCDFGNTANVMLRDDGRVHTPSGDLRVPAVLAGMKGARAYNPFGPSFSGYTLETYRRLPEGWAPAPEGIATDLHMWRKFLALPGIKLGSRPVVTGVHLGSPARVGWSVEQRRAELERFSAMIATSQGRDVLRAGFGDSMATQLWRARANEAVASRRLTEAEARIAQLEAQLAARP